MERTCPVGVGSRVLGHYEVVRQVASSNTSWVVSLKHVSGTGLLRALKLTKAPADEEPWRRISSRWQPLVGLHHPSIVDIVDVVTPARGESFVGLLMEYVDGPSLADVLAGGRRLTETETIQLGERIGAALAYCHARGVIHGRLCPSRVLLPAGRVNLAKIGGFGGVAEDWAKVSDPAGALSYGSPEHFRRGAGWVDGRSDVFSLGLTLLHAGLGAPVPMGESLEQATAVRERDVLVPSTVGPRLRALAQELVLADPAKRAATVMRFEPLASSASLPDRRAPASAPSPLFGPLFWSTATAIGFGLGVGAVLALWSGAEAKPVFPNREVSSPSAHTVAAEYLGQARANAIDVARQMSTLTWRPGARNTMARCVAPGFGYRSDFSPGRTVKGVAYDWGGVDDAKIFEAKMAQGLAAGSHSQHGISACTAGVDCSGLVSLAWGLPPSHRFTTASLSAAVRSAKINRFKDLQPGDALNLPGKHIVIFAGYQSNGAPLVYEANGQIGRVLANSKSTWHRFRRYEVVRLQDFLMTAAARQ